MLETSGGSLPATDCLNEKKDFNKHYAPEKDQEYRNLRGAYRGGGLIKGEGKSLA